MNIKTTVILAVLLLAVGGYLFFTRDTGDEPKKFEEHKLVDVSSSDVTKVVVTPADGKAMTLEKKGADWRMTAPVNTAADPTEVSALIDAVTGLKATNEVEAASGPKTGLDKPQYVVELSGGKPAKVSFGDKVPVGNGVYTKVEGKDPINIVDAAVIERLDKQASAYRQTKLVEANTPDIKQLILTTKAGKIALQKDGENWKMTEPKPVPADTAAVTDLLNVVTGLKATSFVDDTTEQADDMKGNPPVLSVAFSTTAPSTQPAATQPAMTTVTFGAYDDVLKKHVFTGVSGSPFVAKVDTTSMTSLDKKPLDLRDKKVVDINPDEVSRFTATVEVPAQTQPTSMPAVQGDYAVERRHAGAGVPFAATSQPTSKPAIPSTFNLPNTKPPSTWVLADGSDADDTKVKSFLDALHPLKADKYLEAVPAATKAAESRYTAKIHTEAAGGANPMDYEIHFAQRGKDQSLTGQYNGLVFEVPASALTSLTDGHDFKKKPADATATPAAPSPSAP